jgi:hypothetical protein
MTAPLERLIDMAEAQARRILLGTKAQLVPAFVCETPSGAEILGCPWGGNDEKEMAIQVVKGRMNSMGCTRYSFLTEAWMAIAPVGYKEGDPMLPPSKHPDRMECVTALATDGVTTIFRIWKIKRDWKGACVGLDRQTDLESDHTVSRFANLLGGTA